MVFNDNNFFGKRKREFARIFGQISIEDDARIALNYHL